MNTAVVVLNNVALTAAEQYGVHLTKVDLNAATVNDVIFELSATVAGGAPAAVKGVIDVYFAWSTVDIATAANAALTQLQDTADRFSPTINVPVGGTRYYLSDTETKKARYLFVWVSHEKVAAVANLTLKVVH